MHSYHPGSFRNLRIVRACWAATALFIVYATTIPFAFVDDSAAVHEHLGRAIQRVSFAQLSLISRTDVLQNILFFIPFGLLGVASLARRPAIALAAVVTAAIGLSSVCETLQLFTADRVSSLWDVVANTTGAIVGGVAFLVMRESSNRITRRLAPGTLTAPSTYPLIWACALVIIGAWEPFDFTLDVGSVWSKLKPFANDEWWQWQLPTDEGLTAVRYGLLVALACRWIQRHRSFLSPRLVAIVSCTLIAAALEMSQFFITSRQPSLQDLVAAFAGIVGGALSYNWLWRSSRKAELLIAFSVCAAVPFYLQPFVLSATYASVPALLFLAYYERTSLQTVSHVIDLMLIYAPIGFCLEWREARHITRTILIAGFAASTLEYTQGWIVGRYPDVTDVAICVLGTLVGVAAARHGMNAARVIG